MQVVDSLVSALLRADGDALVMHVGEKPTVITASGGVPLTASGLTLASMDELLRDLLPIEAQQALAEFGAVEADLPPTSSARGQRLTVVAARGGDDVWIEIRRQRAAAPLEAEATNPAARAGISDPPGTPGFSNRPPPGARPSPAIVAERRPRDARWRAGASSMPGRLPAETPAVVLPLARNAARSEAMPRPATAPGPSGLERLLRLAAAREADALYLFTNTPPSIRHDGDTSTIEGEKVLGGSDIEALLLEAMADRGREPADAVEWTMEMPEVGRVLAVRVRDWRGTGVVFRMSPARVTPVEQLGLPREIQTLCAETEGLLLVAAPRGGGKSTVVAAMVDQINRTRRDYVVLLETRTTVTHDNRLALVSQREVAGGGALAAAIRGARREGADVIAVEDLATPDALIEAIEAAGSGHLVIAGVAAPSAAAALARLLERVPVPLRDATQAQLAHALRGVIAQVLLRKNAGGRVAAREVLLNGPSVAQLLAAGDFARLPLAIENGRRAGMVPLTDALVGFVQSGAVDVREAWRRAPDRPALLRALKREGIDTSFVERLA